MDKLLDLSDGDKFDAFLEAEQEYVQAFVPDFDGMTFREAYELAYLRDEDAAHTLLGSLGRGIVI